MASAKNWHSVAVLTSPSQYAGFIAALRDNGGRIGLKERFELGCAAMKLVGEYRTAIGAYFAGLDFDRDVKPFIQIRQ